MAPKPGNGKPQRGPARVSAGLLMFRVQGGRLEVFLAHPGGPIFKNKDEGHWTIPKGEVEAGDELLGTAIREFEEETGLRARGEFIPLGWIQQKGGKIVHAWAFVGDEDGQPVIVSNTFDMEWPPKSGRIQSFPEVDRAEFFDPVTARRKLKSTQIPLIDRLEQSLEAQA